MIKELKEGEGERRDEGWEGRKPCSADRQRPREARELKGPAGNMQLACPQEMLGEAPEGPNPPFLVAGALWLPVRDSTMSWA